MSDGVVTLELTDEFFAEGAMSSKPGVCEPKCRRSTPDMSVQRTLEYKFDLAVTIPDVSGEVLMTVVVFAKCKDGVEVLMHDANYCRSSRVLR